MTRAAAPPRPSWVLKATSIAAIALGAVGILTGAAGIGGLLAGDRLDGASLFRAPGPRGERMAELQREMQQEMQAVADEWQGVNMAVLSAHLVVCLGLILGGVLALRLDAQGRVLLVAVFVTAMVVEAARFWPTTAILQGNSEITQRHLDELLPIGDGSATGASQNAAALMRRVTGASALAGWAFTVASMLLKIGFFAFGTVYMSRRAVAGAFRDARGAPPAGPGAR